jgi:hypothetical protein
MGIAIILQVFSLAFAIWTAALVSRVRRRLRSMVATSSSPIHYSLIIRTLIFAVVLAGALRYHSISVAAFPTLTIL